MVKKVRKKPETGEYVKLRGREPRGVLQWVNSRKWCSVDWDDNFPTGTRLCHLDELEVVAR